MAEEKNKLRFQEQHKVQKGYQLNTLNATAETITMRINIEKRKHHEMSTTRTIHIYMNIDSSENKT